MIKIIAKKSSYRLIRYDSGLFVVDYSTKSVGMTVKASFDRKEVEEYFDNLQTAE